jgi:hypothetical protein
MASLAKEQVCGASSESHAPLHPTGASLRLRSLFRFRRLRGYLAWCTIYDAAPIVHNQLRCFVSTDSHTTARAMGAALTRLKALAFETARGPSPAASSLAA